MWIIQEPKKVALWNKRQFEEKKKRRVRNMFKKIQYVYLLKMEGSGVPVLYIGHTVPKG